MEDIQTHHGQNHRTNNDQQSTTYKTNDRETLFAPVLLFLLKIEQYVMNDEKAGLWVQQAEHIRGQLWQIFRKD
jgi:hypothetical protein